MMVIREATVEDIPAMSAVRLAVKENPFNNPDLVKHQDYVDYIINHGKGWVAEVNGTIAGFAIVGLKQKNIWALFVEPSHEKKGMGKQLHDVMMKWYFSQTKNTVWLSTAPGTRAADFYRKAGWKDAGMYGNELKFEMAYEDVR